MKTFIILELNPKEKLEGIGNKASNLQKLLGYGALVPKTWVVPTSVRSLCAADPGIRHNLQAEINALFNNYGTYAVRSSSNLEDSSHYTFAGLFRTLLNVPKDGLVGAIESVWETTDSELVKSYVQRHNLTGQQVEIGVIVQEMVTPVISGVLFSRNPITGANEVVIEAVKGEGTRLVQDGITPSRFVNKAGKWTGLPEENQLPLDVIEKVLQGSRRIIKKAKLPMDFEWVFDGTQVYWVQMREITTLDSVHVYNNRFSKDMMPGMILPLIWSINVPMINAVWTGLLEEMVGKLDIRPEDLAKSFYYRSYFDMGTIGKVFNKVGFPSEGLEMMMGMIPKQTGRPVYRPSMKSLLLLPRFTRFVYSKWRFEKEIEKRLPAIEETLKTYDLKRIKQSNANKILLAIDSLYLTIQKAVYLNILTPILASMYARIVEKEMKKRGYDLENIDLVSGLDETDQYNPSKGLGELNRQWVLLTPEEQDLLLSDNMDQHEASPALQVFTSQFNAFLERFGYLSDNSNNFSVRPWREQPEIVLALVRDFQETPSKSAGKTIQDIPVRGLSGPVLKSFHKRVGRYIYYRERVSRAYTYGYGLFRPHFLRLAELMCQQGWLENPEQIFHLERQEIANAFQSGQGNDLAELANRRSEEMGSLRDVRLPDTIYGDEPPPLVSPGSQVLSGTPTSRGYCCAPARVITGIAEFQKVQQGDVVVIPYSDVGWTPIFAKAGAVIAESGGLLSHSSIIAREYRIPAVVSVSNAMSLRDGQQVSVNGYTGEIMILDNVDEGEPA